MGKMRLFRWSLGLVFLAIALVIGASPSLAMPPADIVSGCTGEYFNNMTLSGSPVLVRTDGAINFTWPIGASPGPGVNTTQYSVRWTCGINVATTGTYTFGILTDDGMNLLIDGNLIIWAWYDQGPTFYSNPVNLAAGNHTIQVQYYNNANGGTAQVSSNISGSVIYYATPVPTYPTPVPYVPAPAPAPAPGSNVFLSGCTGQYYNNTSLAGNPAFTRADASLNFFWPEGASPGAGLNTSNYSARWTCPYNVATAGTYTFSVVTDDGMNVWVDGNLVIGAWYDQPPASYSNSIYLNPGAHTVTVQYYNHDRAGTAKVSSNISGGSTYYPAPAPAPYSNGYLSGCTGEYFNNMTLAGSPVLTRNDGTINFYWPTGASPGPGVSTQNYSVRWTCSINVPNSQTYTVSMLTDDGMNVLVDNNLIIWAFYDQGPSAYSNPVTLGAGGHTVQVQYYNDTNGGTAQVSIH